MRTLKLLHEMTEAMDIRDGLTWLEEREKLNRELMEIDYAAEAGVRKDEAA